MQLPVSRRVLMLSGGSALFLMTLRNDPAFAQDEDVRRLLQQAADRMSALVSFHFEMQTVDGRSTIMDNLELRSVVGDVVRPDSFQATMTARLAILDVSVDIVSIGGKVWVTDPLQGGQAWQQIANGDESGGGAAAFTDLINPDRLFLLAITYLEDPTIEGTEEIYGEECTVITGTFVPQRLQELASPVAQDGPDLDPASLLSADPVYLTAWIAGDGRVFRMLEEGPLTSAESDDVVRQIDFTNFDGDINIEEPAVTE
jgi:hypothetical protein